MLAHHVALERIVVDEDHGVEADVEYLLNLPDIVHLRFPVGHKDGDVVQTQHHVGMLLERFFGLVFVVLAADADDDAALLELLYPHLKLSERLANAQAVTQLDAFHAIVADDTAPLRVVQVEDEAFLKLPLDGTDDVHHAAGHVG